MDKKLNILLCAYACEPDKGSEPGVGWEVSNNLAKKLKENNIFVITRKNNQEPIYKKQIPDNLTFIFYDLPRIFLFIKSKLPFVRTYYYLWMLGATISLWKQRKQFDIIHHVTFVNDWFPSIFILLRHEKAKFIWGPIGSNEKINSKFIFKTKHKIIENIKSLTLSFFRRFDFFFWLCKKRADIIIGTNENVKHKIKLKSKNFLNFPAIAINKPIISKNELSLNDPENFNIISVGQLRYIKNFRLTINAFNQLLKLIPQSEREKVKLQIVGKGPQQKELLDLVTELNLEKNIHFTGQVKQSLLMTCYEKSNVFLFPTLENAGFVILEAMSKSLPVIALEYGGPNQFIKQNRKHQLVDPNIQINEIEERMGGLLFELFQNKNLRTEIGVSNKQTVLEEFTWEKKVDKFVAIYSQLLIKRNANEV